MADAQRLGPLSVNSVGRGIALVLFANLLFSMVDTSTKWLLATGLVFTQLAFMRYAVHFAITSVETGARRSGLPRLQGRLRWLTLLRAFCLVSATCAHFLALGHLPLSIAAALLYLSPIFVFVFAHLLEGEQVRPHNILAATLGLLGALIVLWPFGQPINWYAVLMLYPAASFALYQVLSRMLAGEVATATLQFYTGALGTVCFAPLAFLSWSNPSEPLAWVLLMGIGACAWFGHEVLTRAHGYAAAVTLAPFGYSFVLYLVALGWIVFSEVPPLHVIVGALMILAGGLYTWRHSVAAPRPALKG